MAMAQTARKRDFESQVWAEEHGLMLLLSCVSSRHDKALCKRCGKELTAAVSSGTRHLKGHVGSTECLGTAAARQLAAGPSWDVGDAMAVLQARSPVEAVQWRQGPDTMLLIRQEPRNLAQLQQQGFRVLLLPELERRLEALMQQLWGLMVQQQPAAVAAPAFPKTTTSHIDGWLPELITNGSDDLAAALSQFYPGFDYPAGH